MNSHPSDTETPSVGFGGLESRTLAGLIGWIIFCIVLVIVRGVRWDEHYEIAQALTGAVPYPDAHPFAFWPSYVRNLPIWLSAGILKVFGTPEAVCGVRNVFWLLSSVLPAYLLGAVLGRRALVGHVAALLLLLGLEQSFDANYPLYTWPAYFSNGHVVRGFALVALSLVLAGNWRCAAWMLGFMIPIHAGQAPLLYAFSAAFSVVALLGDHRKKMLRALPWAIPGIVVFTALWSVDSFTLPLPTSGPYYSPEDPQGHRARLSRNRSTLGST